MQLARTFALAVSNGWIGGKAVELMAAREMDSWANVSVIYAEILCVAVILGEAASADGPLYPSWMVRAAVAVVTSTVAIAAALIIMDWLNRSGKEGNYAIAVLLVCFAVPVYIFTGRQKPA